MTPRKPADVGCREPLLVAKNQAPVALTEKGEPAWAIPSNTHTDPTNPTMAHTPKEIGRSGCLVDRGPRVDIAGRSTPVTSGTVARPEGFDTLQTYFLAPKWKSD
jgi:hypothetical protein